MTNFTRQTDWCTLTLDTRLPRIFFHQSWKYKWIAPPGQPAWTYAQTRKFHTAADKMIWGVWSNRVLFSATGGSPTAKLLAGKRIPVSFDIEWALGASHWTVEVTKVPIGYLAHPTRVEWHNRRIILCTEDFRKDRHAGSVVAHEFGHTIGNIARYNRGDEYQPSSPHYADRSSILHEGRELRDRHFRTILEEMNVMIPETQFSASVIQ